MYRWREHTAELELEVEAASVREVFSEAFAGIAELLAGSGGEEAETVVELSAGDRATLLADWLDELVSRADAESFVPRELVELDLDGTSLRAVVRGAYGEPRPLVKAVTYHGLELVQRTDRVWQARVVLDV